MKRLYIVWSILLLCSITTAYAGGIGLRSDSLSVNIEFKPYFEQTYYYSLVTYGTDARDAQIYVEDESADGTDTNVAQYFTISDPMLKNINRKSEPYFSVTLKLPAEIKEPGTHKVHLGAVEVPHGDNGGVSIRTAIEAIFYIYVPYPGQYLDHTFRIKGANQGYPLEATIDIANFGTDPIQKVYATIDLFDADSQRMATTVTNAVSLASREHDKLRANISTINIPPGSYVAKARIVYDGDEVQESKEVKVGELNFKILNLTDTYLTGKINEFTVDVESLWANPVDSVYAELALAGKDHIRTLPLTVAGFQRERLQGFIDMNGVKPGPYDAIVKLYFGGKDISRTIRVNVVKEQLRIPAFEFSLTNVLLLAIILIVLIINISLFMILKRKKEAYEKTQ